MVMRKEELVEFPYRFVRQCDLNNKKCDVMSLGVCLYRILMDKFPFMERATREARTWTREEWLRMWTVETEYFLVKGGESVKIIGYLLLKCMELEEIVTRPYV